MKVEDEVDVDGEDDGKLGAVPLPPSNANAPTRRAPTPAAIGASQSRSLLLLAVSLSH